MQRNQLASIDSFFQHLRWSVFQQRWKQSGGFDSTVWSWNSCINSLHNDLNHFWAMIDCIYCSTWILSNVRNKGIQENRDFDSIDPRIYKRLQKLTLSALTRSPLHVRRPILKPAMVEKRWLAVFIVSCAFGLAVGLDLFQLHVHCVIPCLCSLPVEPSLGLHLGIYVCAGRLTF